MNGTQTKGQKTMAKITGTGAATEEQEYAVTQCGDLIATAKLWRPDGSPLPTDRKRDRVYITTRSWDRSYRFCQTTKLWINRAGVLHVKVGKGVCPAAVRDEANEINQIIAAIPGDDYHF